MIKNEDIHFDNYLGQGELSELPDFDVNSFARGNSVVFLSLIVL
jgi:hypothetical protein